MVISSSARLWEETTFLAYHLHWPLESILDLEHPVRHRLVTEVGRLNQGTAAW